MTFLQQVAHYYVANAQRAAQLANYTFVLPNKRSAMFLRKCFKQAFKGVGFMPKMVTITQFTREFDPTPLASGAEQLFILYTCYRQILKRRGLEAKDFDHFVFWGNVLLKDFSDIDAYMAETHQLFPNIVNLKEIESNYLTPEQLQVLEILGDKRNRQIDDTNFWKHMPSDPTKAKADKLISLWEILGNLYDAFNASLEKKNLSYSGKQTRIAYQVIKGLSKEDFGNKRYAFVGFYVMGTARLLTLKRLKDLGVADFFWDIASPMLHTPGCKAGEFVLPLSREFKMPEDFELEPIEEMPEVDVYQVPSNTGQAKMASELLRDWHEADKKTNKISAESLPSTGVVLPNDKLLTPLLHSLPEEIFPINLSLNVSLSATPFAATLSSILRLQENAHMVRGEYSFYFKDVLEITSNPFVTMVSNEGAMAIRDKITQEHLFNISVRDIQKLPKAQGLMFIFKYIANKSDINEIHDYLSELISTFSHIDGQDKVIEAFGHAIDEILVLTAKYSVVMQDHTYFTMINRILSSTPIQYNSTPVWGLQIMSMADSRDLDFDNLIVMSLNERILPKHNAAPSLIPPTLRAGYGLPTEDNQDSTDSYIFYRLISRAKRLALTYDSRTPDISQGEVSRYVRQLQHVLEPLGRIHFHATTLGMIPSTPRTITIRKTERVIAELQKLKSGKGNINISASALKSYITCPLMFYLREVKRLKFDNFDPEYMDPASYGTIVHAVAEHFYNHLRDESEDKWITAERLANRLKDPDLESYLKDMALEIMNEKYYKNKYSGKLLFIPGEGRVLSRIITKYVMEILRAEAEAMHKSKTIKKFKYLRGEYSGPGNKHMHAWTIYPGCTINFTMSIDRIDQIDDDGNYLRFIDYKTGNDQTAVPTIDDLFTNHDYSAIFQLLLYSVAYAEFEGYKGKIQPLIYKIIDIPKNGIQPIYLGSYSTKKAITNYLDISAIDNQPINESFRERLVDLIKDIFDEGHYDAVNNWVEGKPFEQTTNLDNCKYCNFAQICGRIKRNDDN